MFGRYSQNRVRALGRISNELLVVAGGSGLRAALDLHNLVVSDTHSFSPTLINEARFGWNARNQTNDPPTQGGDWAQAAGHSEREPGNLSRHFEQRRQSLLQSRTGWIQRAPRRRHVFQDNVTKVVYNHTVKFGYELVRTTYDSLVETFPSGRYNLGGTDFPFRTNTGNQFANFLLGQVSSRHFHAGTSAVEATLVVALALCAGRLQADSQPDDQSGRALVLRDHRSRRRTASSRSSIRT